LGVQVLSSAHFALFAHGLPGCVAQNIEP